MTNQRTTLDIGHPWPLGATLEADGVNFALFSAHAASVELCLFDENGEVEQHRLTLPACSDQVWHGFLPDAKAGVLYGFRVHGPFEPAGGHRFNPAKLLIDPYARDFDRVCVVGEADYGYPVGDSIDEADLAIDDRDNGVTAPKCRVVDETFDWRADARLGTPLADSVIYELHVKGFTQLHPEVPQDLRGTYAGLAHPAAIEYLNGLGITAVELLPIHVFVDEPALTAAGLTNYWGYNSLGFFAPTRRYAATNDPVAEFKGMVKALHGAGIEVILDVVYNHTAEGDQLGPALSFRGIDNASYYRLAPDNPRYYVNDTGCGNTVDAWHPGVLQLIMDSLRYWAETMHVDGFRFDLAPALSRGSDGFDPMAPFFAAIRQDPVLADVKLIAEPWDVGPDGYQLGAFPPGWSEWNGTFRDQIRDFWLTRDGTPADLAQSLAGSSALFKHDGRAPQASVNFVTAHDGFGLNDLVTYAEKHNEANGDDNTDGDDHNRSINLGVEGPTDDPDINRLRARLKRNLLATTILAQGVPMVLAGDESSHTKQGNNNSYCQDNELTWLDWNDRDADLEQFTERLLTLRREQPNLRRREWLNGEQNRDEKGAMPDVVWLNSDGCEKGADEWNGESEFCLAMRLAPVEDEATLLALFNPADDSMDFTLPAGRWHVWLDSAADNPDETDNNTPLGEAYHLVERSLVVLRADAG